MDPNSIFGVELDGKKILHKTFSVPLQGDLRTTSMARLLQRGGTP
jgi:hypothetical protein